MVALQQCIADPQDLRADLNRSKLVAQPRRPASQSERRGMLHGDNFGNRLHALEEDLLRLLGDLSERDQGQEESGSQEAPQAMAAGILEARHYQSAHQSQGPRFLRQKGRPGKLCQPSVMGVPV